MRILTVDDNPPHRYFLTRTLTDAGYDTIETHTGEEALKHAEEIPDLVLLDLHLPDMNGFEVCRKLKAQASTAQIPVVMFSAISQAGSVLQDAMQVGAETFLFFPMTANQLVAAVQGGIAKSKQRQST